METRCDLWYYVWHWSFVTFIGAQLWKYNNVNDEETFIPLSLNTVENILSHEQHLIFSSIYLHNHRVSDVSPKHFCQNQTFKPSSGSAHVMLWKKSDQVQYSLCPWVHKPPGQSLSYTTLSTGNCVKPNLNDTVTLVEAGEAKQQIVQERGGVLGYEQWALPWLYEFQSWMRYMDMCDWTAYGTCDHKMTFTPAWSTMHHPQCSI